MRLGKVNRPGAAAPPCHPGHRRVLLGWLASAGLGGFSTVTARRAEANAGDAPALGLNWNANAFAGATPQEALQALGISRSPETSRGFDLVLSEAPGEDGSPAVFALVNLEAREGAGVRRVALLVENLSPPLACRSNRPTAATA